MTERTSFFATPYHPLRAALMARGTYLLLAGDLWFGMIQHGGRYGLGGFNVAHFALLDALLPTPSAGLYVGLIVVCGFVALSLALFEQPRWQRTLLAIAYTLAWSISIHDSYQHHYFLSWLLLWLIALPEQQPRFREASTKDARMIGWGLPMTCVTCAIVYAFTGIAKSEAAWRRGDVLRALTGIGGRTDWGLLTPLHDALVRVGVSDAAWWRSFAYATIALQWTIALGYLLAVRRDRDPSPWRAVGVGAGFMGALAFHITAELSGQFEIGLFSYYMLLLAIALLAPVPVLLPIGRALAIVSERLDRWRMPSATPKAGLLALAPIALLPAVGLNIPLPGAFGACCALAAVLAVRTWTVRRVAPTRVSRVALQGIGCTLLLWIALTQGSVAFDFHRRVAGELRRMGRLEDALEAYRTAERYAPPGRSRADEIRALERRLSGRGTSDSEVDRP